MMTRRHPVLSLLFALLLSLPLLSVGGCAKTAAAQWAAHRSTLSAVQDSSVEAHKAGLISDRTFGKIVPIAQATQRLLAKIEAELPRTADGQIDYDAPGETPSVRELLRTVRDFIEDIKRLQSEKEAINGPDVNFDDDPDGDQDRRPLADPRSRYADARQERGPDHGRRVRAYPRRGEGQRSAVQRVCVAGRGVIGRHCRPRSAC